MAISKVIYTDLNGNSTTWMDATTATAAAADITAPKTAMLANGIVTTGTGSGGGGQPLGDPYLRLSSTASFSLYSNSVGWDGTIQYSTDNTIWTTWNGTSIAAASDGSKYNIYLRGTGNRKVGGSANAYRLVLSASTSDVEISGCFESLLDYGNISNGTYPIMADYAFGYLFYNQSAVKTVTATFVSPHLGMSCYYGMFQGCTSLTTPPALPATVLTYNCYYRMFSGCTSLVEAPALPATVLGAYCYAYMFYGCTRLTTPPTLPATDLNGTTYCYAYMFYGCSALVTAPALPATVLGGNCYYQMFYNCTSLTTPPPTIPASVATASCCYQMFYGCSALTSAPTLPATSFSGNSAYGSMFQGCTSLTTPPALPATQLAQSCYSAMFRGCTALTSLPALPATTLAQQCYYNMFYDCTNIKLSQTSGGEYVNEYRIPTSGTGTTASSALSGTFTNTGGSFTGTPTINTTYYTSNTVVSAS